LTHPIHGLSMPWTLMLRAPFLTKRSSLADLLSQSHKVLWFIATLRNQANNLILACRDGVNKLFE